MEAYDLTQENGSNITPINILDAITFVSEAWKTVKSSTIKNCWRKTGILPNLEERDSDQDQDFIIEDEMNEITLELQGIIDELMLQDPITAEEFIHIDDEVQIELLTDEEIVAAVISNPENDNLPEENEESEMNVITNKEALNSLEQVIRYFKNLPNDITINYTELRVLNALRSKINKQIQDNAKQSTLDSYM